MQFLCLKSEINLELAPWKVQSVNALLSWPLAFRLTWVEGASAIRLLPGLGQTYIAPFSRSFSVPPPPKVMVAPPRQGFVVSKVFEAVSLKGTILPWQIPRSLMSLTTFFNFLDTLVKDTRKIKDNRIIMFIVSYFPFGDQAFTHSLDTRSGNCWHSWNSRGSSSQSTCAHVSWPNMEYAQPFPNAQLEPPLVQRFWRTQAHRFHVLNPHWSSFFLPCYMQCSDPSAWRSTWYVRPRTPCSTPGTPIPRWAWVHLNWKIAASFCSCKM